MIDEQIKKLLISELENDQLLGWELVAAKKIPYSEIIQFIKEVNETSMGYSFYWFNDRFKLNRYVSYGTGSPGSVLTVTSSGTAVWVPDSTRTVHLTMQNEKIQEKKRMGKARKIWADIKAFIKRL